MTGKSTTTFSGKSKHTNFPSANAYTMKPAVMYKVPRKA
jgi:hypothetical protein